MLKQSFIISTLAALVLAGCSGTSSTDTVSSSVTDITVERGPVDGAAVTDANGKLAQYMGQARYRFTSAPTYPISAEGGYIDINRNGSIEAGEVKLQYKLEAKQGDVITVVTTLASNTQVRVMLQEEFGLSDEEIDTATPGTNKTIAAISDEAYAYCLENNLSTMNLSEEQALQIQERIHARIAMYTESNQSVSEFENALMNELRIERITESELPGIQQELREAQDTDMNTSEHNQTLEQLQTMINDIPDANLTDLQKEGLIYMAEEEKLARDVYEYLYAAWGDDIFTNIASSEQQHMEAVLLLLEKYELNVPATLESRGVFENNELQSLYDQLIAKGVLSLTDALEVGVTIEEVDIADLNVRLETDLPEDLELVYEHLLYGSYNHLEAFNSQLAIQ
ncbi:DUF2202 domain-containing protein [Sulfurovum sp. zt1-1]|uniref:DUF2202 domain-containing protein n=1 Tax=Sulfurovum zhangzhouensis TaxID=3019067 RepID=A0ABT7R047_9BACT|nr:DUF2202 domain-containing protein [Sulfurovum zhangzhouensis]MDM5272464.1 DUF2202 domain-containing protein [Sulfurovum zhangzhouensis]